MGAVSGGTLSDGAGPIDDGDVSDDDDGDEAREPGAAGAAGVAGVGSCDVASDGGRDVGNVSGDSGAVAGVVEHPATTITRTDDNERTRGRNMEWILLEAAIALGIGVFIAWWLMRGKDRSPRDR